MEPNPVIIAATAKHTASVSDFSSIIFNMGMLSGINLNFHVFQLIFFHGLGDTGLVLVFEIPKL